MLAIPKRCEESLPAVRRRSAIPVTLSEGMPILCEGIPKVEEPALSKPEGTPAKPTITRHGRAGLQAPAAAQERWAFLGSQGAPSLVSELAKGTCKSGFWVKLFWVEQRFSAAIRNVKEDRLQPLR